MAGNDRPGCPEANGVHLSPRQWGIVASSIVALYILFPHIWMGLERLEIGPDYRIPYSLSEDYWHFRRVSHRAAQEDAALVIGDSVVWGEYVRPHETLTCHLNRLSQGETFLNLGVNGIHPAALAGLIQYHGRSIAHQRIVLHCNLLWMCSPERDLQSQKEVRFNHPDAIPQFNPPVPSYKEPDGRRLGVVVNRFYWPSLWRKHLSMLYFDNYDLPHWTKENPSRNPVHAVTCSLPSPLPDPRHRQVSWMDAGIERTSFDWVEADSSIQWRLFRRTVEILRDRDNQLLVVLGPFNEHMIDENGLSAYKAIHEEAVRWFKEEDVSFVVPSLLPSDLYGDASHPLSEGYEQMAEEILDWIDEDDSFT